MKTADLIGPALDWAVAKCEGIKIEIGEGPTLTMKADHDYWSPSTDWAQGGPIIEREGIDVMHVRFPDLTVLWEATIDGGQSYYNGPTLLIAAMRCFVASRLGDEVDVPEGLE